MQKTLIHHGIDLLCLMTLLVVADPSSAQINILNNSQIRGYDEYRGAYAQFGVSAGEIDFDELGNTNVNGDPGGGFGITGGYRLNSWLSLEANMTYIGGGDVELGNTNVGDGEAFAFLFGPKIYFLGALPELPIAELFQPYFTIGIGGGEVENDGKNGFADEERSSFVARFIGGFDLWLTDHVGIFLEGGYHVWDDDLVDGIGLGTLGAQYRF